MHLVPTIMNSDDYSDLADLNSDEYKRKQKSYRIKNVFKVPSATTYTVQPPYGEKLHVHLRLSRF